MDESGESGDICRVEDDNDMLYVRAILLDEITEFSCNLAIALEKVLAGHAFLTWCTAGRDDVLCSGEGNLRIGCPGNVGTFECAVAHFLSYTVNSRLENVVKTDVGSETEHESGLNHVGTDSSTGSYYGQFLVS